jgi:N4-gp56 family major capsid protein
MGIQSIESTQARLGRFAGAIIKHAIPVEVLAKTASQMEMPKNKSDTLIVRSWVPYGASAAQPNQWTVAAETHITQEGVTPDADTIVPRDVTFVMEQFMILYSITDKAYDMFEDDLTDAMKEQTGERTGLVKEMYLYGKLKAATTKFYGGGGATRASVNTTVTATLLGKIDRSLKANHSTRLTKILNPSPSFGTSSVSASWIVYHHTDLDWDVQNLPGFTKVADYGSRQPISEWETGSFGNFRFVSSPELTPYLNAGAAVGATGLKAQSTNVDVYPMLFIARDSYASVALRGMDSVTPIMLMPSNQDKSDPGGQRGYVGAKWYDASGILNQGWIHVLEVGATAL